MRVKILQNVVKILITNLYIPLMVGRFLENKKCLDKLLLKENWKQKKK